METPYTGPERRHDAERWQDCPIKYQLETHIKEVESEPRDLREWMKECTDHVLQVQEMKNEQFDKRIGNVEKDVKEIKNDLNEVKVKTNSTNAILKWMLGILTAVIISGLIAIATDIKNHVYQKVENTNASTK